MGGGGDIYHCRHGRPPSAVARCRLTSPSLPPSNAIVHLCCWTPILVLIGVTLFATAASPSSSIAAAMKMPPPPNACVVRQRKHIDVMLLHHPWVLPDWALASVVASSTAYCRVLLMSMGVMPSRHRPKKCWWVDYSLGGVAFFFASITAICFAELLLSILMNLLARIASGTVDAGHRNKYVVVCWMPLSACRPIPDMFGKIFGQWYSMIYW
jgi:hypothetical protein